MEKGVNRERKEIRKRNKYRDNSLRNEKMETVMYNGKREEG